MSNAAWETYTESYPELCDSDDFGRGFRNGFYRYVKTGCEAAPPLPPSHYMSASFVSPEGKQAIADWFNGYHIGVILAQQSGSRDFVQLDSPIAIDSSVGVHRPGSLGEEEIPQDAIAPEAEPDR